MSTIPDFVKHAKEGMLKAIENAKKEFTGIRSGKASTHLLDVVRVEAYGNHVPMNQVGLVSAPEPRMLTVQPFDKSLTIAIEKAIRESQLGLNPSTQGNLIRIPIPALSEERRKELVKVLHRLAEEAKVAIRHARTEALQKIKKVDRVSEDEKTRGEKDVQKITDEHVKLIDQMIHAKEAEIMEV